jgi:maltose-binding protein MalE
MLFIILGFLIVFLSQCTKSVGENKIDATNKVAEGDNKNKGTNPQGENQILKVSVSMKEEEFAILQKQSTQYTEAHPKMVVELTNLPAKDAYAELKKQNQLGDAPDLMLMDNNWVKEFAALGFLHPMDEYFTGEQKSDGIIALMNQVKWNGYLWALPKDVDPYILVWNTKTASENKWDHPPTNSEEWFAWNKAMMHPEEGKYGVYMDPSDPYAFLSFFSSLDDNGSLSKLNDPALIKRFESFYAPQEAVWNTKNLQKNYPSPSPTWDPWALLSKGKMAAMVTTVSEFKLHSNDAITLAALLYKKNSTTTEAVNVGLLKGRSYCISSRSKNSTLAVNWMKEMTSIGTDLVVWNETKLLPSLPTAYFETPILNDTNYKSFVWLIDNGKVLPVESETNQKVSSFQNELQKLWIGEQTMKQFLENSSKLWLPEKSGS